MKIFRVFVIIIICALTLFPTSSGVAFAATSVYSDVLEDLQKDESFDKNDYPINQTDYSLELIQIAESSTGELLAYVYQPSAGAKGILTKKIRIKYPNSDTYNDYDLTLLSKNGVFYKYKVDGYVTDYDSATERVYEVVQIMRSASADLGDKVLDENNNTITYVPYPVGWTFYAKATSDGNVIYGKEKDKSITVTDKYCGQLLFENAGNSFTAGLLGSVEYGMLHFIAFNADITIDELYQADVSYTIDVYEDYLNKVMGVIQTEYKDKVISSERLSKTLSYETVGTYQGDFLSHKYTWKEIMSCEDFINNVCTQSSAFFNSSLTEKGSEEISDKAWVLVLGATGITNISRSTGVGNYESRYTRSCLTDETILRLEGKSNGVLFNLGVVDNYQTGDGIPDNKEDYGVNEKWWKEWWEDMQEWFRYIFIFLASVILVVLIVILAPPIAKLLKFIFKIITAPFRWLFGSKKKRR